MSATLRGIWTKDDGEFLAEVRCGGKGTDMVGRTAILRSKAGDVTHVTLTEVVKDYGANDVATFRVDRLR